MRVRALLLAMASLCAASSAAAQPRFEAAIGITWTGGFDAGGSNALESGGSPGTPPLTLFNQRSRVEAAPGLSARATYFFSSHLGVEASAQASRPLLRTTISGDFENATGSEAVSRLSSYVFGGSLLYRFGRGRLSPFAIGGGGRLRQLDDDNVTLVTASELHLGGGLNYRLSRHVGVRGEAVASVRDRSLAFDGKRRTLPVIAASLAYRF